MKKLNFEDKQILRDFVLEKQTPFTLKDLHAETEVNLRTLTRFINSLVEENMLQRNVTPAWTYSVIFNEPTWKIQ